MRVIDLDTRIEPLGDRVGDLPCLDLSFDGFRAREVEQSGIDPNRLTMIDAAFASAPLLRRFAKKASGPSALAVSVDDVAKNYVPVSSVRRVDDLFVFDIFLDTNGDDLDTLRASATPVVVPWDGSVRRREWPRVGPGPHHIDLVDDGILAMHVEHWVHVLWLWPALVRRLGRPKRNVIGKHTNIHPSAILECAVIGDDVEIGANSSIRHSYIGPGSKLSDFTKIAYATIGEDTHTLADATMSEIVALGGGTLTNLLFKDSVVGRRVFVTTGVTFWTDRLDGNVTVAHRGHEVDTGRPVLGGCAGHGAILGARTILAPGRALPNRTTVVMRKSEGVFRVREVEAGTEMCWDRGELVPMTEAK